VESSIDGFYSAFLTGREGNSFAMFLIRRGVVAGADVLGGTYDGRVETVSNGTHKIKLTVRIPPNLQLIQGGMSGAGGDTSETEFSLPSTFLTEPFVSIETKNGPVNVKLVKIRGIDD
jgi:hypothetical protein